MLVLIKNQSVINQVDIEFIEWVNRLSYDRFAFYRSTKQLLSQYITSKENK